MTPKRVTALVTVTFDGPADRVVDLDLLVDRIEHGLQDDPDFANVKVGVDDFGPADGPLAERGQW